MPGKDKKNAGMMNLIKRMHGVVENVDIEKHRHSQDYFGAILGNNKEVIVENVEIATRGEDGRSIHGEWIYVNRAHMKKYIILYCHGGGYSTGSAFMRGR